MQIFQELWFQANVGPWVTNKIWNGGLTERPGGREKVVLRAAHTHTHIPFSGEYLPSVKLFTIRYKMNTDNTPKYLEKCYL